MTPVTTPGTRIYAGPYQTDCRSHGRIQRRSSSLLTAAAVPAAALLLTCCCLLTLPNPGHAMTLLPADLAALPKLDNSVNMLSCWPVYRIADNTTNTNTTNNTTTGGLNTTTITTTGGLLSSEPPPAGTQAPPQHNPFNVTMNVTVRHSDVYTAAPPDLLPNATEFVGVSCTTLTSANLSSVCTQQNVVLVLDEFGCFFAARAYAGYRPMDISDKSGGEVVWCSTILRRLNRLNHTFVVTRTATLAEECVLTGQQAQPVPAHHVFFVHGGWWKVMGKTSLLKGHIVRPPFREECTVTMHFYGADEPTIIWPGDLRYYLTVWPNKFSNAYTFLEKPHDCPATPRYRPVPLPTYGVLFEKFKSMPDRVNSTDPLFNNATLWQALRQLVHLVVLDCSDVLADKLGWGPNWRDHVTCWKDSPLRNSISYHNLMMGAAFFLGLGATPVSPTPVDCIHCRTPVIMPPYQHPTVAQHAGTREFYPVESVEGVVLAVSQVLSECKVSLVPLGEEEVNEDGSMAVRKTNSCFAEPGTFETRFTEAGMTWNLGHMLSSRKLLCHNRPHENP